MGRMGFSNNNRRRADGGRPRRWDRRTLRPRLCLGRRYRDQEIRDSVGWARPTIFFHSPMPNYRRAYIPGGTFFLTLVTHDRAPLFADSDNVAKLRAAVAATRAERAFEVVAALVLPDHAHFIWTLPPGDIDFSKRVGRVKVLCTRSLRGRGAIPQRLSASRDVHRESTGWSRARIVGSTRASNVGWIAATTIATGGATARAAARCSLTGLTSPGERANERTWVGRAHPTAARNRCVRPRRVGMAHLATTNAAAPAVGICPH